MSRFLMSISYLCLLSVDFEKRLMGRVSIQALPFLHHLLHLSPHFIHMKLLLDPSTHLSNYGQKKKLSPGKQKHHKCRQDSYEEHKEKKVFSRREPQFHGGLDFPLRHNEVCGKYWRKW
ncbi:hypothetical protein JTE90_024864 [Oedothorax gibbosus]|uniref:Uncharacterized protein n=1 Tax=Oedothorax gibbosus TaxID=931172 RepID=A0AAV6V3A2_9ARAC|nr:hypothetical protein JTE90_024864 [Oedothorax gibbosus]